VATKAVIQHRANDKQQVVMIRLIKNKLKDLVFSVPAEVRNRFLPLEQAKLDALRGGLEEHYFVAWRSQKSQGETKYKIDLQNHLTKRLAYDRTRIIPWINSIAPLANMKILEVGCGTGSSTLALAEQGAQVVGIDVEEESLKVAKLRCELFGVSARFIAGNALELKNLVDLSSFDMLIFFACLEHMTIEERLESLKLVWNGLRPGAFLVVIETPNRLWFYDGHTSLLPFYHWLPDKLAFYYSKFSPRENFNNLYRDYDEETSLHFLRRGRGMSFHEFDIALGDSRELNIVSCLTTYDWLGKWKLSRRTRGYANFLKRTFPGLHDGFCFPNLNLVIKKK
jgi:2-polyprenyl-3-methyl-5-hydroxy-6-metoxy-1,4-benzoquinol methylase